MGIEFLEKGGKMVLDWWDGSERGESEGLRTDRYIGERGGNVVFEWWDKGGNRIWNAREKEKKSERKRRNQTVLAEQQFWGIV